MMHSTRATRFIAAAVTTVLLTAACSVHKNTARSRLWQSFTARYNTYYNGHQAFLDGMLEKEKGNKDNYTELLPMFTVGNKQSRQIGSGQFDRAVEKMEKAIKQHSIKARPEWNKSRRKTARDREWLSRREYNPFLWKAWLLLGQAQYQKGQFDEAAATFSYMSRLYATQPAINSCARAWLARCYIELDWMYDAEDVIRNMSRDSIPYTAQNAWNQALACYYVRQADYAQAVPVLRKVISRERRKVQKARLWFLMGQMETALGHRQQAYKAFGRVAAQNPPYELEFNARIAQTEVMGTVNARKMISRLKAMARSDNNKDYLGQVYYAMGNIHLTQNDTMKAIDAYEQAGREPTFGGVEKGVLLLRLGGIYWQLERYNDAQRCYGEAIGLLDRDRPDYAELAMRSKVLDELVPHTDAVHLQDSLLQLADMPEAQRLEVVDRIIEALKKQEKEERDKALEAEVERQQQRQAATGNRNQSPASTTPANQQKDTQWYFYNTMAVNQGKQTFIRQWGKRENTDNWRRSNITVVAAPATDNEETDSLAPADSVANADTTADTETGSSPQIADSLADDPHNREYYLAQIPFTDEQKAQSHLIIQEGLYNAGVIFKDKLENLTLAQRQLTRLLNQYPDYAQTDQALYHLFLLYSRQGNNAAADSCLQQLKDRFPDSDWTILLSDPLYAENARFGVHIEDSLYAATYLAFKDNSHSTVMANAALSAQRFPLGQHRPKFLFINGLSLLNQGDVPGCVAQLSTVVEKYPESEVSELAGMIVKGVQEGRQLYGGKFDLDDIWSRRDISAETDSLNTDTLSADRNVPFVFLLAYQPDSLNEHQLLYELARFNFTNFLVRNFDLATERQEGISRMVISGFLNFDEALQYARQLTAAPQLTDLLRHCRTLVISQQNLEKIGRRYSYRDYDLFYERWLLPLPVSNEELLQTPEFIEQPDEDDDPTPQPQDNATPQRNSYDFDLDDLF